MAGLKADRKGNQYVTFWFASKQFTKSAGTRDEATARAIKARVEETIFHLNKGYLSMPDGADPGEFIVSGGMRATKVVAQAVSEPQVALTLGDLFRLYAEHMPAEAKAETTVAMEGFHKAHLLRIFGHDAAVKEMTLADVQRYANRRSKESYRASPSSRRRSRRNSRPCG